MSQDIGTVRHILKTSVDMFAFQSNVPMFSQVSHRNTPTSEFSLIAVEPRKNIESCLWEIRKSQKHAFLRHWGGRKSMSLNRWGSNGPSHNGLMAEKGNVFHLCREIQSQYKGRGKSLRRRGSWWEARWRCCKGWRGNGWGSRVGRSRLPLLGGGLEQVCELREGKLEKWGIGKGQRS